MHEIELHKECLPSLSDNILSLALTRFYFFFSLSLSFVAPQATINNFARQFGNRNNKNIIATLRRRRSNSPKEIAKEKETKEK